jgi:hypothetical protein
MERERERERERTLHQETVTITNPDGILKEYKKNIHCCK